jgi:hypothetical protein
MLVFVGIVLSAASLLINIIGLAIPYWNYVSAGNLKHYYGLWSACTSAGGNSVCIDTPDAILGIY